MDENEGLNMEIKTFVEIAEPIYRKAAREIVRACREAGIEYQRQVELLRTPELDGELYLEYSDILEESSEVDIVGVKLGDSTLSRMRAAEKRRLSMGENDELNKEIKAFVEIAEPRYRNAVKEIVAACKDAGIPYRRHCEILRFPELIEELRKEVPMNLLKPGLL